MNSCIPVGIPTRLESACHMPIFQLKSPELCEGRARATRSAPRAKATLRQTVQPDKQGQTRAAQVMSMEAVAPQSFQVGSARRKAACS